MLLAGAATVESCHEDPALSDLCNEAREIERSLGVAIHHCRESRRENDNVCAYRRSLAWQTESLELRLLPVVGELAAAREARVELEKRYSSEIADLRIRLDTAVDFNSELRNRCTELEKHANLAEVGAVTPGLKNDARSCGRA